MRKREPQKNVPIFIAQSGPFILHPAHHLFVTPSHFVLSTRDSRHSSFQDETQDAIAKSMKE